jgi:isopenicillin N synthase-like dioxygenase
MAQGSPLLLSILVVVVGLLFTRVVVHKPRGGSAKVTAVDVPIIDVSGIFSESLDERRAVARKIGAACQDIGFIVIKNHGVPEHILENMWRETAAFFDRPVEEKLTYIKPQSEYPFGYTKFMGEVLSAGKQAEKLSKDEAHQYGSTAAPDLKEMFSLGPANPDAGFPARIFPTQPEGMQKAWEEYYEHMTTLAHRLLRSFALALELPDELFFEQFVGHHASALRALNYPHLEGVEPVPGQLRASAHTDYGTLTILRADAPGLQVSKDKDEPDWHPVPFVPEGLIINLGDLMKRWTNDRWLSTLHRVVNPEKGAPGRGWFGENSTRRQSVAFFHNLNKDAVVINLTKESSKYASIVAGDFLMEKHLAATQPLEHKKKEL